MFDQEIVRNFIGREREKQIFKQWLDAPTAPWILYLYDAAEEQEKKGGVGKTWLLRACADWVRSLRKDITVVMVDFFNVVDRDGVVVATRIVNALKEKYPDWHPEFFTQHLAEYTDLLANSKDVEDVRERLSQALVADLDDLSDRLRGTGKHLLVFFDTFEVIEQNPATAILLPAQKFPDNYHFEHMSVVVAGRNAPDWTHPNWQERQQEVRLVPISPFSQEEVIQYISSNARYSLSYPEQARALYDRTEGRPILVGLVNDVLNYRVMTLDKLLTVPEADFEAYLVERINDIEKPMNWITLFMAHAYHRFNLKLLDWILSKASLKLAIQTIQYQELEDKLPTLSFVRRSDSTADFVLHDEMQRLVTKYCWPSQDPDLRYRQEVSLCTIGYYEQTLAEVANEQIRQAYIVEMLYHKLFLDMASGLNYFNEHFNRAVSLWMTGFARSLLREAQKFVSNMSSEQRYGLKFAEAKLLRKEDSPEAALDIHRELEQEAAQSWLDVHRADLLYEQGICYQEMSKFDKATDCFRACLPIEEELGHNARRAEILYLLGFISRREGQLDIAVDHYAQSIDIHKKANDQREYANVLNSLANVYRLQGKIEEALRLCRIAWRIRYELWKTGNGSETALGLSINTLGIIYFNTDDLTSAQRLFQDAHEIFTRTGYKKGIAASYVRFGQVLMARGELREAQLSFEKAYHTSSRIDTETRINSLNKWGWSLVLQEKWQEAVPLLEQAIDLAKQYHDYYQEAESLIDLADALARMGEHERSQQALQEGVAIAERYNYNLLLGIAEEFQGDIKYQQRDYQGAFQHLGASCQYMARYNPVRYNKALRKIVDLLLRETPVAEIAAITRMLIAYWTNQGLTKDFPELIKACEEVHSHMVL